MDYQNEHVLTLANSIIGVGVLAMPYCFKQCGILLSIVMLLISSIISRLSCHFLLKSAINSRRKTFEILAFHIFGTMGKFITEIGIIGFLLGTCIAFFVVMGDLTPEIICQITGLKRNETLRTCILIALALFCVLPLGLLRNVDSLCGVSKATIGFYGCLIIKIIADALPHLFTGDWFSKVNWWRPSGIMQCIPIFSMALFCQTQLFEMYQILPNLSLEKLNNLVRVAVTICTWVYIFVGSFGYIAFFGKPFGGNILLSFSPSNATDLIKIGFVFSVVFSFPLVIFPCRASLHSLFYRKVYTLYEGSVGSNYIPETTFKMLTFLIVFTSLVIGILIPNIELVLGLIGSTIGVMICILFPATCFICITQKNTNEKLLAQIMLFIGGAVMVLGTFANMSAYQRNIDFEISAEQLDVIPPVNFNIIKNQENNMQNQISQNDIPDAKLVDIKENFPIPQKELTDTLKEIRHEPLEPIEIDQVTLKKIEPNQFKTVQKILTEMSDSKIEKDKFPTQKNNPENSKLSSNFMSKNSENLQTKNENYLNIITQKNISKEESKLNSSLNLVSNNNVKKSQEKMKNIEEDVDIEAIKKEEIELKADEEETKKEDKKTIDSNVLLQSLNKQNEVQKQLLVEQNELLKEALKDHKNFDIKKMKEDDKILLEKMRAVQQIENIAIKAIESISGKKTDGLSNSSVLNKIANIEVAKFSNSSSISKQKLQNDVTQEKHVLNKNFNTDERSDHKMRKKNISIKIQNQIPLVKPINLTEIKFKPKTNSSDMFPKEKNKISNVINEVPKNSSQNLTKDGGPKASIVNLLLNGNSYNGSKNLHSQMLKSPNLTEKNPKGER